MKLQQLDRSTYESVQVDAAAGSFLLKEIGRLCAVGQDLREFVLNGVQACQRASKSGKFPGKEWHVKVVKSPYHANKVAFMDNGESMNRAELIESFKVFKRNIGRAHYDNFGIGGKAAGLANSPYGIEYLCWRDNVGVRGLLFVSPNGEVGYKVEPLDLEPPSWFVGTGTVVIPLGEDEHESTLESPFEANSGWSSGGNSRLRYLNEKLWAIPDGISIHAKNFQENPIIGPRPVRGYKFFLDLPDVKQESGTLAFPNLGVEVDWYITKKELKEARTKGKGVGAAMTGQDHHGRVAVLFEDELYQIRKSSDGHIHQRFGVWTAQGRVHIYVRPTNLKYKADPARRTVVPDEDMDTIAAAFKENLPAPIKQLLKEYSKKPREIDHDQLRRWHAFHGEAFHRCKVGILNAKAGTEIIEPGSGEPYKPRDPNPNPDPDPAPPREKPEPKEEKGGDKGGKGIARGIGKLPKIEVVWVTDPISDDENIFARFELEGRMLTLYDNWPELEKWLAAYEREEDKSIGVDDAKRDEVQKEYKEYLNLTLQDVILSRMEDLKRGKITDEQFHLAMNEYALTSVASQRIAPVSVVARNVNAKFGKTKTAAAGADSGD